MKGTQDMKPINIFAAAAVSSLIAGAAVAETTTYANDTAAADAVTAVTDAIKEDQRSVTFGNDGRTVGTYGSVALRATSTQSVTSNDTVSIGIGGNYGFFDGTNGSELTLAYNYGSTNNVADTNQLLAAYDFYHNITPDFFGYAAVNLNYDELAIATANKRDAFVGFGLGYRLVNTATMQLGVQAGPGYRYIELGDGTKMNEAAGSAEVNFQYNINKNVYLTNDITLIGSKSDYTATNTLALNVAMTDALSLRTSYVSDFSGTDFNSLKNGDNTLGVSVVYSFK